ncbi:NAD(P)H-binding protein [Allorhizocola rhizosphaerae]|uniref:NAD(P)H-binding protein n=1 Tax=Allorhizocola rhizosphaerae TaxID=1872709 RepID=UPI000E3CF653|nr:NAD(P)H-binding protein [Allorhizocola rhizosphaerae]
MTILVTGATGNVGRNVVKHLVAGGHAVRALSRDPQNARLPERVEVVAGDLSLPVPDKEAAIAAAIGEPIEFVELSEAEARAKWAAEGLPPEVIEFFVMAHGNPPEAAWTVLPTVEQITGRPALSLVDWAAEHAHLFR